jgi:cell division protein FtsB
MTIRRGVLVFMVLILLGLQVRLWTGPGSFAQVNALQERVEVQQLVNESKFERNRILSAEVTDLKNGLGSIEEKARSELGWIKKGETFFFIASPRKPDHP